ncbi:DUF2939 domain-containing protein [Bosea vestrisii]|uniref:DUF2939 domain-containing protein n=1 Tax=Bosea vestrisii TaxID=151416 RepID=UPI0024DFD970|nr:DUF2939 domain-containing protein [Bosea vestrisii]WID98034.1 DUF2939 domain-containing protein [Bosea vestrisii]
MTQAGLAQDDVVAPAPSRRSVKVLLGILVALLIGYWLSPYVGVARFLMAAQTGRGEEVLGRVDLPAVRGALAKQVVRAYVAREPQMRELDPLARRVVSGAAVGYVDAIIAEHMTPEAITALLAARNAGSRSGTGPAGLTLPRAGEFAGAWDLFAASGFDGPADFVVVLPQATDANEAERYRLRFGLKGWRWQLRAIELPSATISRLVEELKARVGRGS